MDSTAQTARPALEIIIESASTGDTWIRQRRQPLRPHKSLTKLLPRVTHGFDSAKSHVGYEIINKNRVAVESEIINETASTGDAWIRHRKDPCRLRNHQQKLSRCRIKNHQRNCFHGLGMDSTAQTAPPASEIITENASTGDACIRQRKQPLRP
jgi:hypothetical protein